MSKKNPMWRCSRCGQPLPTSGRIWDKRYRDFLLYISKHPEMRESGCLCDSCAVNQELGFDYE